MQKKYVIKCTAQQSNSPDDVVVSVHTEGKVVHLLLLLLLLLLPLHDGQRGAQGAVRQCECRDADTAQQF